MEHMLDVIASAHNPTPLLLGLATIAAGIAAMMLPVAIWLESRPSRLQRMYLRRHKARRARLAKFLATCRT